MMLPTICADGRTWVSAQVDGAYRTLLVHEVRPRKRTLVLERGARRPEVEVDAVLEVWVKPPRARKARRVWARSGA